MKKIVSFLRDNLSQIVIFAIFNLIYFLAIFLNNVDISVFKLGLEICTLVFLIHMIIKFFEYDRDISKDERIANLEMEIDDNRNSYIKWQNDIQEYFSMWVHQIKTPITCMEALIENDENNDLKIQLKSIENYTNMAINYLKLNLHEEDMYIQVVDLDKLISDLIKNYSLLFISSHIKLDFKRNGLKCITDSKWLSILLEQVISNAIKYSKNSRVIIDTFSRGKDVVICIEDEGIGIPKADIPRIFDKGYSGFNGRLKEKSSGLGLYLAKNIANKLDIDLKVESEVNVGSKFYVIVKG